MDRERARGADPLRPAGRDLRRGIAVRGVLPLRCGGAAPAVLRLLPTRPLRAAFARDPALSQAFAAHLAAALMRAPASGTARHHAADRTPARPAGGPGRCDRRGAGAQVADFDCGRSGRDAARALPGHRRARSARRARTPGPRTGAAARRPARPHPPRSDRADMTTRPPRTCAARSSPEEEPGQAPQEGKRHAEEDRSGRGRIGIQGLAISGNPAPPKPGKSHGSFVGRIGRSPECPRKPMGHGGGDGADFQPPPSCNGLRFMFFARVH